MLAIVEVDSKEVEAVGKSGHGARMPEKLATSKEAAHFIRKCHTKIIKAEEPTGFARWESFGN